MVTASDAPVVSSTEIDPLGVRTDIKLAVRTKLGWGLGGFCESLMANGMPTLANPIYNIALKLDPVKLGVIGSLPRFFDAVYDIWLGNLSDNARTQWGRRRPFIAVGAVLCTIFFTAVWWVPVGWGATGQLCFFGLMSSGYWLSFSTFAIPYNALGFELTSEFNERTSVQAYRFFVIQIGGLVLASLYPLCFAKIFAGHAGGRVPPEVTGARWVTLLFGVAVLVAGLAPAVFGREQHVADHQPRVPLPAALRLTFTDTLFLHFMSMIVVSIFGVTIASSIGLYITIYYVFDGNKQAAANMLFVASLFVVGMTLLLTLVLPTVSKRVGKRGTILLGQSLLICSGVSAWWLYTPKHPYWLIGSSFLSTAGMACFQILYGSFLGDICDVDELRCGTRREGMYGAAATFLNKLIYASQGMLVGAVLAWAGYSAKQSMQTPDAIWRMRTLYSAAPGVFAAIGVGLAMTFPITARRAAETQRLLAERRAATTAGHAVVGEII